MTQEVYRYTHGLQSNMQMPAGKHCKKLYIVTVMLSPSGPCQQFSIWGIEEARKCAAGFWKHEIIRAYDGKKME